MLASAFRLKSPRDIARVFKRGRFGGEDAVHLKFTPNGMEVSRVVIVVSKKVSKKATVRNRIRRRVSGVIEQRWATVAPGYDIVVTVRDDVSSLQASKLADMIESALRRSQLLIAK